MKYIIRSFYKYLFWEIIELKRKIVIGYLRTAKKN